MSDKRRYLIEIDWPQGTLTLPAAKTLLAGTGIELDERYGPFAVDAARHRYVVRGVADEAARANLAQLPGVQLFADARVEAIKPDHNTQEK